MTAIEIILCVVGKKKKQALSLSVVNQTNALRLLDVTICGRNHLQKSQYYSDVNNMIFAIKTNNLDGCAISRTQNLISCASRSTFIIFIFNYTMNCFNKTIEVDNNIFVFIIWSTNKAFYLTNSYLMNNVHLDQQCMYDNHVLPLWVDVFILLLCLP